MFCGAFHERLQEVTLLQIPDLPVRSERIRPFDDGNGRLGRLLMLKECLRHGVTPFILDDKRRFACLEVLRLRGLDRGVLCLIRARSAYSPAWS